MFRKTAFVLATAAVLAGAALTPTSASARPFGHGWGLGVGIAAGLVGAAVVADRCVHREVFHTPYGWRTRWVNVCY
jgi:hypothetical protein